MTSFNPSNASIILEAYDRIGIRPAEITREQMSSAVRSINYELQSMANFVPLLWKVDLRSIVLEQGTATYDLPDDTVTILDVYIQTQAGNPSNDPIDRILLPISRTDYAMYPDKTIQAPPSVFWYDRLQSPTITVWQTPDGNGPYTLFYYRMARMDDAATQMGQTADVQYLFLEALVAGVTARLAQKFRPELFAAMKADAKERLAEAISENIERVDTYILPEISGYWNP